MTLAELLPALHGVAKSDKLRAIQILAADVAREDEEMNVQNVSTFPVWSPCEAYEGADVLLRLLEEDEEN